MTDEIGGYGKLDAKPEGQDIWERQGGELQESFWEGEERKWGIGYPSEAVHDAAWKGWGVEMS